MSCIVGIQLRRLKRIAEGGQQREADVGDSGNPEG